MKNILLASVTLLLISCSPITPSTTPEPTATATPFPGTRPDDFQLEYYWEAGSLPEPYSYHYKITIGPENEGEIVFSPGYSDDKPLEWRETFSVTKTQLDQLYAQLLEIGALNEGWQQSPDIPDGGSADKMTVSAYGQQVLIPSFVDGEQNASDIRAVYEAIRGLVPNTVWSELEGRHQDYIETHEED